MRSIFIALVSVLILSTSILAQNGTLHCPMLEVTSPAGVTSPGESMTFTVKIGNEIESSRLGYDWTASAGVIVEGQNTPKIRIATTSEMDGVMVSVKVIIKGLPENCVDSASEMAKVDSMIFDLETDSYGKTSLRKEFARFDMLISLLQNNPNSKGFVKMEIDEKNVTVGQTKKRITKIIEYIKYRKFTKSRFLFAIKKSAFNLTEIQVIPENTELPECKNCEIIKGEDVN